MTICKTLQFPDNSKNGEELSSLNLKIPDSYNSGDLQIKSNYLIYRSLKVQQGNQRQGTASTKTRSEVRGGGRKPWKQKGTGRARAGSTRSPLWKGGGVSFGPKPKNFQQKINRKEWRLSLRLLLLNKEKNINIIEMDATRFIKTNDIYKYLKNFVTDPLGKAIIIVPKIEENLMRITKNLRNIKLLQANCLNIQDILLAKYLLISKKSLKIIEETYNHE